MIRLTLTAFPLLVLILGLSTWLLGVVGVIGANQILERFPPTILLATWCFEACGLLALFLLIERPAKRWWVDGLLAGWIAWVFRGPLLVITFVLIAGQSHSVWWTMIFSWWLTYTFCGLALAAVRESTR